MIQHKNGCHNLPRPTPESSYTVQDGWREYEERGAVVRVPVWKKVPHMLSTSCQYDKRLTDKACDGCAHKGKL